MASRKNSSPGAASASLDQDKKEEPSFEAAMARLSEIVEELESGELSLEASLERFEEGIQLARRSQARLDAAEAKVEQLLGFDDEGAPVTEEM